LKGFFKITENKDWKKLFSKKELKYIEKVFYVHFSKTVERFNTEVDYIENLKLNNHILHVDTGEWDDTCGVRPKQMKKFLANIPAKFLFIALSKAQLEFNNLQSKADFTEYSEDHNCTFYDFNEFWKTLAFNEKVLIEYKKSEKERKIKERAAKEVALFLSELKKIRYGEDFFNMLESKDKLEIKSKFSKVRKIDKDLLFSKNKDLWLEFQNFIPKAEEMLIIDPRKFSKEPFLKALSKIHKIKQLNSLNVSERRRFVDLYLVFGNDLFEIPFHLLKTGENSFFFNSMELNEKSSNKAFLKLIRNISKGIVPDIGLTELALFNFILSSNKLIFDKFLSNKDIFWKDIESIIGIGEYTERLKKSGYINLLPSLMNTPKDSLENIFKLDFKSILDLFNKTKNNNQTLPTFKSDFGGYTFEVIDKTDIRGYICGYPFSCQYIGGVGSRFTKYGYTNENSSFMIVSKKGVIIAQSWIWIKDNQMTFDSIEWKGGLSKPAIKEGYEAYADHVMAIDSDIEKVTVGNCQGIFSSEIKSYSKLKNTVAGHCYDSDTQFKVREG